MDNAIALGSKRLLIEYKNVFKTHVYILYGMIIKFHPTTAKYEIPCFCDMSTFAFLGILLTSFKFECKKKEIQREILLERLQNFRNSTKNSVPVFVNFFHKGTV